MTRLAHLEVEKERVIKDTRNNEIELTPSPFPPPLGRGKGEGVRDTNNEVRNGVWIVIKTGD